MAILDPKNFIGRSAQQVEEFLAQVVSPIVTKYQDKLGREAELSV